MQVIVFVHKYHIRQYQCCTCTHKIYPVRQQCIRAKINKTERYYQLHSHIQQAHRHVAHLQFVRHQLVRMFSVCLSQMLMQHHAMEDGHTAINTKHDKEHGIRHILCHHHQPSPSAHNIIKAIPILPTSPAKHFALPFGLKLKMLNTNPPIIATIRYDYSINPYSLFSSDRGISIASAYPAVMPLIPSIKLMIFVASTLCYSPPLKTFNQRGISATLLSEKQCLPDYNPAGFLIHFFFFYGNTSF